MSANDAFFSSGHLTVIPSGIANPTPIQIARLRDVSVKATKDTKPLETGDRIMAVDKAWAGLQIKLTAKSVEWRADAIAAILSGAVTLGVGRMIGVDGETGTIPANPGPYTLTATHTTGHVDLGVEDTTLSKAAGVRKFLKRVAATPATGEYSVALGVYTFAAADTGHTVRRRYYYNDASVGKTATIKNIAPCLDPSFIATVFNTNAAGKDYGFKFINAHIDNFGLTFKTKDWTEHDVEIDLISNDDDDVGEIYKNE